MGVRKPEPVFDIDKELENARRHVRNAKEHEMGTDAYRFARLAIDLKLIVDTVERKMHDLAARLDDGLRKADASFLKLAKQTTDQLDTVNKRSTELMRANNALEKRVVSLTKALDGAEKRIAKLAANQRV